MRTRLRRPPRLLAKTRPEGGTLLTPTPCPNCGEDILDLEYSCPNCGWIDSRRINQSNFALVASLAFLVLAVGSCSYVPSSDRVGSGIQMAGGTFVLVPVVIVFVMFSIEVVKVGLNNKKRTPMPPLTDDQSPYPRPQTSNVALLARSTNYIALGLILTVGGLTVFFRGNDIWPLQVALVGTAIAAIAYSLVRGKLK